MSLELAARPFPIPRQLPRRLLHGHEWRLVSDDVDEFGPVRMFECTGCRDVRYA